MRLIDFTVTGWGHNHTLTLDPKHGDYRGFIWSTPGPKVGDEIKWEANYGFTILEITESTWTVNVDDMYKVTAKVVRREAGPDVDQDELDEYFKDNKWLS